MSHNVSRRKFIKTAGIGAAGFAILPSLYSKAAPSDKLRIAHIGLGGMGNNHLKWFANIP